jgi:hypothetical protein
MPTLKERLQKDMVEALRAREAGRQRLSVIRLLRTAVLNAEKEGRGEMDDAAVMAVLSREGKRLQSDIEEFERLGQHDRAQALVAELVIVKEYLPAGLSLAEVEALARETVVQVGATKPGDMGKVMKALMPKLAGRADGKLASDIVKRLLDSSQPEHP